VGPPGALAPAVQREIYAADRNLPVIGMRTLERQIDTALVRERLFATLTGVLGLLALALAAIGLYGLMAYTVTRRMGEIGLRMALGATRRDVLRLVARDTALLVGAGFLAGIPAALGAAQLVSKLFYGVSPDDPATFVSVVMLLAGVAALATAIPVRRAMRVDPTAALRHE
jgi:putative ABC transport system permease protein